MSNYSRNQNVAYYSIENDVQQSNEPFSFQLGARASRDLSGDRGVSNNLDQYQSD